MYIALNPIKARQFTTKGIHLTLLKPIGYVPEDLDTEFRSKIDKAVIAEEIYVVPDNETNGIFIPGVGKSTGIDSEEKREGTYNVNREAVDNTIEEVKDLFGNTLRVRKLRYTLTLSKDTDVDRPAGIILTDKD